MAAYGHGRLATVLTTLAILAGACAPAAGPAPAAAPMAAGGAVPSAAPVRGGTLVFAIWQEPAGLLPNYASQTVAGVVGSVAIEGLTDTDTDGNFIPVLAKQVPTLANGGVKMVAGGKMDVTYELIPDVKWSDGTPLTSADVKFTWETYVKDPKVITKDGYSAIEAVDTPTSTTVVLHYKQIYGPYLTRFGGLLPKSLEKEADLSKSEYNRKPIGTGPFRISEFVAGDHITAERNPSYRVKDRPYLDRIIFRSVPSREAAIAQLKAGEVDGMWNILEAQVPDLSADQSVRVIATPSATVERIELNLAKPGDPADPSLRHPVLGDRAVRRALNLATPKQQIIDKLLFGKAKVGTSPVSQGWASPKGLSQESYDPNQANRVLDDAGWTKGADGVRAKNGVRAALTIMTTSGDKVREQIEQILVDEWRRIGIDLAIKNLPSVVVLSGSFANDPRKRGSFDAVMYASTPAIDPHTTMVQRYTTSGIPTSANSGQNFTRFSNPEADAAIAEAGATVDQPRRAELYAKALRLLNDDVAIIWLYDRQSLDAFRANVSGPRGSVWQPITFNAMDWSIRK